MLACDSLHCKDRFISTHFIPSTKFIIKNFKVIKCGSTEKRILSPKCTNVDKKVTLTAFVAAQFDLGLLGIRF